MTQNATGGEPSAEEPAGRYVHLPNEILDMILDHVGDDKPTLARCMRTSPPLNLLAAPRLYTPHLRWASHQSYPLAIPTSPNGSLHNRLSPTKIENLELMRTFHLDNHLLSDCSPIATNPFEQEDVVPVPILFYDICFSWERSTSGSYHMVNHLHTPVDSRCSVLPHIAPRKLVITKSAWKEFLPIRSIDDRFLEKVVTNIDLRQARLAPNDPPRRQDIQPFFSSTAIDKTVVYIITELDPDDERYPGHGIPLFATHLTEVVFRPKFAEMVLIVDATSRMREGDKYQSYCCKNTHNTLEEAVRASVVKELETVKAYWAAGGAQHVYKTISGAEATIIKFISSKEYLEKYDTEGEFTDDQRMRLMRSDKEEVVEFEGGGSQIT